MNEMQNVIEGSPVKRGARSLFRIVVIVGVVLALLAGCVLAGASWWVMRKMGPEIWVKMLEENYNCRCQIDDANLSLLSRPAKLVFAGVKIAPRDAEVAKPLSDRTPLADGIAPIVIPEIVLSVKLDDLLNKRIFIEQLKIDSPVVTEMQDEQGRSSLEALFRKLSAESEMPLAIPVNAPAAASKPVVTERSSGYTFAVNSASLERGQMTITNKKTLIQVSDFFFTLSDIDIQHADLALHNRMHSTLGASIKVRGEARIGGVKRPAELANLKLSGEGDLVPIDLATGDWMPTTTLKLTLAQGSVLAGHITIGDAAGKELKKLQEYGVDLAPVSIGGALLEPAIVEGVFKNNFFGLRSDTRFVFSEYEVLIEKSSWFNGSQDKHEMDFRLSCGAALQARLQAGVAKAKLGESLTSGVIKALSDKRGRMTFDIESKGSLSDPEVKPKLDRILKNLIRGEGLGDLLQGLLKKL